MIETVEEALEGTDPRAGHDHAAVEIPGSNGDMCTRKMCLDTATIHGRRERNTVLHP